MSKPLAETDLGPPVIAWLEEQGWDVYQEVDFGTVADLVGRRGNLLCTVELKRSLTFEVIAQAAHWTNYAHLSWAAVPVARNSNGRWLAEAVCEWRGVGLLSIYQGGAKVRVSPRLQRRIIPGLADRLRPEQKTWAPAGDAECRRWTPFRGTCHELAQTVAQRPGITMREAVDNIHHHYRGGAASARASLTHWIEEGKVAGVRLVREGKAVRLYPVEAA